jgi:hypothetical protein
MFRSVSNVYPRCSSDTARDAAVGGLGGAELGHHHHGDASGTHGNRDGLAGAAAGGAYGAGKGRECLG